MVICSIKPSGTLTLNLRACLPLAYTHVKQCGLVYVSHNLIHKIVSLTLPYTCVILCLRYHYTCVDLPDTGRCSLSEVAWGSPHSSVECVFSLALHCSHCLPSFLWLWWQSLSLLAFVYFIKVSISKFPWLYRNIYLYSLFIMISYIII